THLLLCCLSVPQVEVEAGEKSVLLPCRTRDNLPGDARVEWKDGENDTVHVYKNGSDQSKKQDEFYSKRTKMNEDLLRTGDLSLTLSYPTDKDSNIFTCRVYSKEGNILMRKQVQLKVKGQCYRSRMFLILHPCLSSISVKHRHPRFKFLFNPKKTSRQVSSEHLDVFWSCPIYLRMDSVDLVKVKEGANSVTLPFKTTPDLPGDTVVRWLDKRDNKVYVVKNGKDQAKVQEDYRGRAKMKDDPLNTGDLSLILMKPTKKDSGRYYCGVHHQDIRRKPLSPHYKQLWTK
ncbi:PREDICTED: uncharacterized protein LOC107097460, partial [Cyprinodon variegatus]|uniref:uncharacterized protein LOC107097460 n=1 Tax=Cyprinodon variegatus TaxID=28743 RepID=UPI000742A496